MQQHLLFGQSVTSHFTQQRGRMEAVVNDMAADQLSDPEAAVEQLIAAHDTNVPRLVREKVTFSTDDVGGQVSVTATVPFEGSRTFFSIQPESRV